jgi:hypothetical protein
VSLKNIDLRLLECAEVLLRECNVTVGAERLQMSQGNMSNSLARLWLSNEGLNWVPLRSIAQATLSRRSPTERRARAWP